jgi:hypothetical protein
MHIFKIATGYRLDSQGFIPGRGKIFLYSTAQYNIENYYFQ